MLHSDDDEHQDNISVTLPSYTPSQDTPPYTNHPANDEERLAISARNGENAVASAGMFRVSSAKAGGIILQLDHQEESALIPSFGRRAIISGKVTLSRPQGVQCVEMELEGQLKLSIAEGGDKNRPLFRVVHSIWHSSNQEQTCPNALEFAIPMPTFYTDGATARPLPPSYQIIFPGVPGLFANTVYAIAVRVLKARALLWKKLFVLSTPMKYYPRTRAPRIIMKSNAPFFSLVKSVPEDFCQVLTTMRTRNKSEFAPIHCLLFIPSTCIYAISDEIPFHVQLVAPVSSLLALMSSHDSNGTSRTSTIAHIRSALHQRFATTHEGSTASTHSDSSTPNSASLPASIRQNFSNISSSFTRARVNHHDVVRVYLLRQIIVEVRGQRAWRTCALGEGKLTPSPPGHCPPHPYPHAHSVVAPSHTCIRRASSTYSRNSRTQGIASPTMDPIDCLDWDGVVRVRDPYEIQTGGFAAGNLVVKDFIVLELEPPDPARNPLVTLQHAHPIRLVTDSLENNSMA